MSETYWELWNLAQIMCDPTKSQIANDIECAKLVVLLAQNPGTISFAKSELKRLMKEYAE